MRVSQKKAASTKPKGTSTPKIEAVSSAASVVVLGAFNPTIFQPTWLRANSIIGDEDIEYETDDRSPLVFKDLSIIKLAGIELVAQRDRLLINAKQDPLVLAKDVALGCLKLLSHTPTRALGLNRIVTFRCFTRTSYDHLGDTLAPKAPWNELLGDMKSARTGGLRAMTMERSPRQDKRPGYVRVVVTVPVGTAFDTQVEVNDHYDITRDGGMVPASVVCDLIEERWNDSLSESDKIIKSLQELAREPA